MPGLQLPGGPFVQVGHVESYTHWSFSDRKDDGETTAGFTLDFHTQPELMLEAADVLAELAGAMRREANAALDHKAQLREVTF